MYRYSNGQISLADFKQPVGMNLKESNRWVKKAQTIPWLEIEKRCAALFTNRKGNVAKPLRLALGACIIQDEETALMIQENPYLQYFCGYPGYDDEKLPFDPSLMVYFRKRLTPEVLGEINEMNVRDAKERQVKEAESKDDDDDSDGQPGTGGNSGTMIVDATCAPSNIRYPQDEQMMERRIAQIEKETGTVLEEMQKKAVVEAAGNGLFVLTGGPGTGKTTTINAIIRFFEGEGATLRLAAPTGRAAKRMTEATGYEAQTIHRLLELNGVPDEDGRESQGVHFERNAENPLDTDVIIIDEMSMVDIFLMHSLLLAVTAGTRIILVGDENQLPSVGPGNVLRDIIQSGVFPVVELKKIFRQASHSDIVVNAHKIHNGEQVSLDNKSRDFFFLKRYDADIIIRVVIALIQEKLPKYVDARPFEIQVLTPMRKGLLGVERMNQILQRYLNPPESGKKEKEIGDRLFREGDKVMQIRNNYQLEWEVRGKYGIPVEEGVGVFNGDTGILKEINEFAETATVEFEDGRFADYSFKQLEELELAYAITIHKSQGSEYPAVILPLLSGPKMLMNRNLLYTGVTRARKCVTVVGSEETFGEMIRNEKQQKRYSSLWARIQELSGSVVSKTVSSVSQDS